VEAGQAGFDHGPRKEGRSPLRQKNFFFFFLFLKSSNKYAFLSRKNSFSQVDPKQKLSEI
jgi:hypothetical protein